MILSRQKTASVLDELRKKYPLIPENANISRDGFSIDYFNDSEIGMLTLTFQYPVKIKDLADAISVVVNTEEI
jgi:hypothetical protein